MAIIAVAVVDRFSAQNPYFLVIEYCDGGTLESLVAEQKSANAAQASRMWRLQSSVSML